MIILFGIAGSGKGTQAGLLSKRMGWPTLSSGEVLRQNSNNPVIKEALDVGKLVDDRQLLPLLDKELSKISEGQKEFILDGTPRNVDQARWLVEKIKSGQLKLTALIHIKLSEEMALERLKLRGRQDDDPEAIPGRFRFYEQSVVPAMEYLKSEGYKIDEVGGDGTPDQVEKSIQRILEVKNAS